ncbi:sublancin family glycopeptide [Bacillus paramycoides]|uniref:sublancin family glycopeptide n=1 Tax=Bacillus paramycoides TaxID=2026194 RepID=UPI003D030602
MKELMKELKIEELEKYEGGSDSVNYMNQHDGGGAGGGSGIGVGQCAYFWTLCASTASERWGCGSTQANCEYFKKYC